MKHLNKMAAAILACAAMYNAHAATEFEDSVPAEVVTQILGALVGAPMRIYADIPDGFPPFDMPRDMTVLAGVDQNYSQRVILKSAFDAQAATALAYGALLDSGWELIPMPGMQQPQTGFINPYQPVPQTQLCHDDYGMMQVSAQGGLGTTYVNLVRNVMPPGMPAQTCEPQQAVMREPQIQNPYLELQEAMPRLMLPNTAGMASSGGYGGGSGSPNEWETRAMLNGDWDIQRVYDYFSDQVEAQEWTRDAEIVGAQMASGSWTKTDAEGVELVGNLMVLATADNAYDLRFRLIRKAPPGQQGFGMMGGGIRDTNMRFVPAPALGIRGIPAGAAEAGIRAAPMNTPVIGR